MLTNNYSFNSPGKQQQNDTLETDDKFITLINNLSNLIKTYYYLCKDNNEEIFHFLSSYESNITLLLSIIKDFLQNNASNKLIERILEIEINIKLINSPFHSNLEKNQENLKMFIEEAKEIFKQMKYLRHEKLNNNNINKIKHQLIKKKYEYNSNVKSKNNMETFRVNDIRNSTTFNNYV